METPIAPIPTPNIYLKSIEIENEGKKYNCKIQIIKELLDISLYLDNIIQYEGYISLPKIQIQISTFIDFNINEIFEEINLLNNDNFSLIKIEDKYKLKIKFIILRKEKYLLINLNKNKNINKDDLINHISELKEIIKKKDEKIKNLENKLKKYIKEENTNEINNNLYNNFNIKLKEYPIHELKFHTNRVLCLNILKDGRLVSGSDDHSIIIYNKNTYKPDLIIKEHSNYVNCIIQLSSGILASCSDDHTIKLFNINGNNYNIIQTLNYHTNYVYKIIELENKQLVSCSYDQSVIFYFKENN